MAHKFLRVMAAALCGVLILSACGKSDSPNSQTAEMDEPAAATKIDAPLRVLQTDSQFSYSAITDAGLYHIDPLSNPDRSTNIKYLDFQTRQEIPLCSAPNCTHRGPQCTSWLEPNGGCLLMNTGDDRLLLFYPEADMLRKQLGRKALPHLEVCNLDGSERRELVTFELPVVPQPPFVTDGKDLYCMATTIENANHARYILHIDTTTGEWEKMYPLEDIYAETLVGAVGEYFILFGMKDTPDVGMSQNFPIGCIYRMSVNTGEKELVMEINNGTRPGLVRGGKLAYVDVEENSVHLLDIVSGEDRVLSNQLWDLSQGPRYFWICDFTEDHVLIGVFDGDNETEFLSVDGSTGTVSNFTMTYRPNPEMDPRPCERVATVGDNYLVICDQVPVEYEIESEDGVPMTGQSTKPVYAFISAKDYWDSKAEFSKIA